MKHILSLLSVLVTLPLTAENLLLNSSFELGDAGYQICQFLPLESPESACRRPELDPKEKIHGAFSLKCPNPRGEWMQMISHEVELKNGQEYTISAWMKSDRPLSLKLELFTVAHHPPEIVNRWYTRSKTVRITPEWKRFHFTIRAEKPFLHPFLKISWNGGSVWFDALQISAGKLLEYTPASKLEFAVIGPERITSPGAQKLKLKGINYSGKALSAVLTLNLDDRYFGKTLSSISREQILPGGESVEIPLPFATPNGVFRAGGTVKCGKETVPLLPFDFGSAPELSRKRIDPDTVFTIGYSGANGVFSAPNGKHAFRVISGDIKGHYAMLRRQGIRINRLHDDNLFRWETIESVPGKYDWNTLDRIIDIGLQYGIETMPVLGGKAMLDKPGKTPRDEWHIRKNSRSSGLWMGGRHQGWLPPEKAWSDFVENLVRHCRGRVRYYEIINEPNLYMTPEHYARYLKLAYEAAKKADPDCRIVGICSTGDLGGQLGKFIEACEKLGAFQYLDILSFHPYSAQIDSFPTPAEQQIREIRAITDRYRKNLPIWNTELYYIQSCPSDQKIGGITDWIAAGKFPARNTAKRYLIDLGAGTKSSIALNGYQHLHNDLRPHFGYSSQWAIAEMIPNAHFIVGNTFARFLEGAVPVKQLKLLDGINGFLYRTRDKKEIAAVWAINEDETFKADFSASGIRVLDLFGNPLPGNAPIALTADPCYLSGKDLSRRLKSVIFHPERAYSITGIRQSAENGKKALAVEVRNHTAGNLALTLRMKGCETIRKVKLKGEKRKTLLFPLESEQKEITLLSSDGKIVESHTFPFSPVKSLRNRERVALNESCCFQVKSDEKALTVTIDVRDRKRGNRPLKSPWEGDCIELFFDACPTEHLDRNPYTPHVFRLFLAPKSANGLPEEFSGSRNWNLSRLRYRIHDTGGDYSARVTIPWKELHLAGPSPIGIDLILNNSDGEKRSSAVPWAGNSFNWRDRFNFGIYIP